MFLLFTRFYRLHKVGCSPQKLQRSSALRKMLQRLSDCFTLPEVEIPSAQKTPDFYVNKARGIFSKSWTRSRNRALMFGNEPSKSFRRSLRTLRSSSLSKLLALKREGSLRSNTKVLETLRTVQAARLHFRGWAPDLRRRGGLRGASRGA